MVAYIYLVKLNIDNNVMYKVGMCNQEPGNYIKRVKAYPSKSQICFIINVPELKAYNIEQSLINTFSQHFQLAQGKEFFHGNEHQIQKMFMDHIYECMCSVEFDINEIPSHNTIQQKVQTITELTEQNKCDINKIFRSPDTGFVVDIEHVSEWLHTRKTDLIHTLRTSYKQNIDYTLKRIKPRVKYGNNLVECLITPDCFKRLCMLSRSKNAEQIRTLFSLNL